MRILLLFLLVGALGSSAVAEQIQPDHRWTVQVGDGYWGITGGYPGRRPQVTYFSCGSAIFEVPLPFFAVVGCVSLPFVVAGVLLWRITSRRHEHTTA
jgi:hypothetical protein